MKLFCTLKYHFTAFKYTLLIIACLISTYFVAHIFSSFKIPQYTVLLNRLETQPYPLSPLQLYYESPTNGDIRTYKFTYTHLTPLQIPTSSYTEGFLSTLKKDKLLTQINTQTHPEVPLTYFYNYYEDPYYQIVAPTGPLSQIYFINQITSSVQSPLYPNSPSFYLNHIVRDGAVYYLLGDTTNAYSSELYTLDATSLKVLHHTHFNTSSFNIYKQHSSLNPKGHVFYITEKGLGHLSPHIAKAHLIPLNFTPSYILSQTQQTIALNLDDAFLNYAQLDDYGKLIHQGNACLPEENIHLVKALLQDHYLTLLTFTPTHPLYTNYILVYDTSNWGLLYCCGLENIYPYTALDFDLFK